MSRHALIVDDDPIIRNLMAALLRRKRVSSSQAVNGEEAITLLRDALEHSADVPFDLIVLDMMMPKASGLDVVTFLESRHPEMLRHIIVVSAAGETHLDQLRSRGCGCVMEKPFDPDEFYKAVSRCMRGGGNGRPEGGAGGGTITFSCFLI